MTMSSCEMTGTLPMLGSIMLAMDRPMAAAMLWPATTTAATTICRIRPMVAPIMIWLKTSTRPWALVGSITGQVYRG